MKKSKKLSAAALEIINDINLRLRRGAIKDTNNDLFRFACDYLLKKNMYHVLKRSTEKQPVMEMDI